MRRSDAAVAHSLTGWPTPASPCGRSCRSDRRAPIGSPYWVRSDFAGNPAFIDPAELPDLNPRAYRADFSQARAPGSHDYALFEALSCAHGGAPFWRWPAELRDREP